MLEPRRHRVAGPHTEATERTGIEPTPRLVRRHLTARVRDEVAAVTDNDGVAIEQRDEVPVHAHGMDRAGIGTQLDLSRVALRLLGLAQRLLPRLGIGRL